jgi:cation diffusion facilitator family transporter
MAEPRLKNLVLLSILAALLTLGMKTAAWWITGSVGLLSDAAESVVNLMAALIAYFSLWYASKPVDVSHTYGHDKIEYFSSGLEGMLILVAAAGIAWEAIRRLFTPEPLGYLGIGVGIALAASLINLAVAQVLIRAGRRARSITMEADGQHLMTDVWTSVAVVAGLGLVWLTGLRQLDSLVALVMAGNIVWTGLDLVRRSFNGLMDHALPLAEQAQVRTAIEACLQPGTAYHALRTRQAGSRRFADFHLLVPGVLSVRQAHEVATRIESAVRAALADMEVTVHIEPIEERAAWEDSELLELERRTQEGSTTGDAAVRREEREKER